jgi:hypothetical protein
VAADTARELPLSRKIACPTSEKNILEGTDESWEQYKKGIGTRVASTKDLNALLDSL